VSSFQLPSTDEKADYVQKQFDRIAKKYDLANNLISLGMHRLWKQRAIKELTESLSSRDRNPYLLDVCTGTGDLALSLAEKFPGGCQITGLDFSGEMLAVAEQRSAHAPSAVRSCLNWKQGDAQSLPFADNSFDGAIISFGLRNLTDLQKGLNEMSRVVKPGGRVVNLDLGQPTMPVFTPFFLFFFDNIVPLIGELIQQDRQAYTYLPESRKAYPNPQKLSSMFQNAGLSDVRWISLACGSVALHVGTV
jgi:demethylmenaquinone methyltransferase/2-methoxy-6-polyprenyl-1,4-benzoquinol methylase